MADLSFLKTSEEWQQFETYEARVSGTLAGRRIIALCSYDVGKFDANEMLDVARHHRFALIRRDGESGVLENAKTRVAQPMVREFDTGVEEHVRDRTAVLERALHEQQLAAVRLTS